MQRQTPHNTGVKHMEFTIKGRREKESINEIRSKPKPADVTAKTALMSPSVCTAVQNRRHPRPVSLKAAISAQTNAPERAESISGHPAPGTLRLGRTEPCHRLRIRTISAARAKPYAPLRSGVSAQASEPQPQQQGAERLRSAIRRMYKRAGADKGIVPLSYRRRSTPALCHPQDERSCPRKRRNNVPGSSGRNTHTQPFAVCTNVPVLMKESYLCHTEGGVRPRSAIRRTSGRVRASVGTTSPTAANGTPVLGNSPYVRTCRC